VNPSCASTSRGGIYGCSRRLPTRIRGALQLPQMIAVPKRGVFLGTALGCPQALQKTFPFGEASSAVCSLLRDAGERLRTARNSRFQRLILAHILAKGAAGKSSTANSM